MNVTLTEEKTIWMSAGSTVMLACNGSLSEVTQLTWKKNQSVLLSYKPENQLHISEEATRLNINMSVSETQQYELIIKRAEVNHTGFYTCEAMTPRGVLENTWELIITGVLISPNLCIITTV